MEEKDFFIKKEKSYLAYSLYFAFVHRRYTNKQNR